MDNNLYDEASRKKYEQFVEKRDVINQRLERENTLLSSDVQQELSVESKAKGAMKVKKFSVGELTKGVPKNVVIGGTEIPTQVRKKKPGESKAEKSRRNAANDADEDLKDKNKQISRYVEQIEEKKENGERVPQSLLKKTLEAQLKFLNMEEIAREKEERYQGKEISPADYALNKLERHEKQLKLYADYAEVAEGKNKERALEKIELFKELIAIEAANVHKLNEKAKEAISIEEDAFQDAFQKKENTKGIVEQLREKRAKEENRIKGAFAGNEEKINKNIPSTVLAFLEKDKFSSDENKISEKKYSKEEIRDFYEKGKPLNFDPIYEKINSVRELMKIMVYNWKDLEPENIMQNVEKMDDLRQFIFMVEKLDKGIKDGIIKDNSMEDDVFIQAIQAKQAKQPIENGIMNNFLEKYLEVGKYIDKVLTINGVGKDYEDVPINEMKESMEGLRRVITW